MIFHTLKMCTDDAGPEQSLLLLSLSFVFILVSCAYPDKMSPNAAFHLCLYCLAKYLCFLVSRIKWILTNGQLFIHFGFINVLYHIFHFLIQQTRDFVSCCSCCYRKSLLEEKSSYMYA